MSSSPENKNDCDSSSDFESEHLSKKLVCKTYLITYSQTDEKLCSNREKFSQLVLESIQQSKSKAEVMQWAVCKERSPLRV